MKYLDAPFWLAVVSGLLLASAASCFAVAASAQEGTRALLASL